MLIRALLALLALPGLVAFAAPLLIAWSGVRESSFNALALVLLVPGITLLLWCTRDFFVAGKGTLAPWDPPTAEMFARTYPERVAGIVFVDAANSLFLPRLAEMSGRITALACTVGTLARFGVVRLLDPFGLGSESEGARRSAGIAYGARPWTAICATARGLDATRREFEQAPPLPPDLPVIALSASSSRQIMPPFAEAFFDAEQIRAEIEAAHQVVAKQARGTWKKVADSTHLIADRQPDAVADVVFDLLDQLRTGG
jgi:pimeloyl-ACP methyl ester carboxylesterase